MGGGVTESALQRCLGGEEGAIEEVDGERR